MAEEYTFQEQSGEPKKDLAKHLINYAGSVSVTTNYKIKGTAISYTACTESRQSSDPWNEPDLNLEDFYKLTSKGIKPGTKPQLTTSSVSLVGDSADKYYVLKREKITEGEAIKIYLTTNNTFDISTATLLNTLSLVDPDDSTKRICPKAIYVILQGAGGGGGSSKSVILVDCGGGGGGGSGGTAGAVITFEEVGVEWYVQLGQYGRGESPGRMSWLSSSKGGGEATASYIYCNSGGKGGSVEGNNYGWGGAGGGTAYNNADLATKKIYCVSRFNGADGGSAGKESSSAGAGISSNVIFYCTNVTNEKDNTANKKARAASSNTGGDPGTAYHGTRWFGAGGGGGSSFWYKGGAGGNGEGAGTTSGTQGTWGSGGGGAGGNKNTGTATSGGYGGKAELTIYYGYGLNN